jgi:hypothetical protein
VTEETAAHQRSQVAWIASLVALGGVGALVVGTWAFKRDRVEIGSILYLGSAVAGAVGVFLAVQAWRDGSRWRVISIFAFLLSALLAAFWLYTGANLALCVNGSIPCGDD